MTNILQIKSSIFTTGGQSGALTDAFVKQLADKTQAQVIVRNLAQEPIGHLDEAGFMAFLAKPEDRTAEQQVRVALSDELIKELKDADVVVLGLPMYNFGIPSSLKAYFDHIARAGETFKYTETGPVGLIDNKKVYVVATRGGKYHGTPNDTVTSYIKIFLGFLGITDVEFVYAEGLNLGEESKAASLASATTELQQKAA